MDDISIAEVAKSVRALSMDAIQKANSGHPGLPLGCAELGAMLYGEFMNYDPKHPSWMNRDRFVLSAGHGSMLIYSLLHMAGFDISLDDIKNFRQIGSKCAGHPEYGHTPGVETTTGPLGQGFATAVGMAMAETMLSARFNTASHNIFDYYTWVLVGDGCLQEGITSEAASLAATLQLGKLIVFYDDNSITIDGKTDLCFTEDVAARFKAYGWHVEKGSMYDAAGIRNMVSSAKAEKNKPSLIMLKSIIGKGSPTMQGTSKVHGAALGVEEVAKAKAEMGIEGDFWVSEQAKSFFSGKMLELCTLHKSWQAKYDAWRKANPSLATELDAMVSGKMLGSVEWPVFTDAVATRNVSGAALTAIYSAHSGIVGGSADLTGPNVTKLPGAVYSASSREGRMIYYGVREQAMAAISNGLALSGAFRPFCATFLVFADYLRGSLRMSAIMKLPVIYILTHDSVFVGEDGPTHQPIEHLASLRAIPNLLVLRPADAEETVEAWKWALAHTTGPTALILTRQNLPAIKKADPVWQNTFRTGAYVVQNCASEPDVVVVASGSEVSLSLEAAKLVPNKAVRVVSVPSLETFLKQPIEIRNAIVPPNCKVVGCEAGVEMGWSKLTNTFLGIERFGESGPGAKVAAHLGLTKEALAKLIMSS